MKQRAFTIIELLQGMLLCALIAGAAASFLTATATAWGYSQSTQTFVTTRVQTHRMISNLSASARMVGAISNAGDAGNSSGDSAVLLWQADANIDGKIQQGELTLLIHNHTTQELRKVTYFSNSPATEWTSAAFLNSSSIDAITSLAGEAQVVARSVKSIQFSARQPDTDSARGTLSYQMVITRGGDDHSVAGTIAMRAIYGEQSIGDAALSESLATSSMSSSSSSSKSSSKSEEDDD